MKPINIYRLKLLLKTKKSQRDELIKAMYKINTKKQKAR